MRAAAYQLALFFICLNVSLYIVAETQVLPIYMPPYENSSNMIARTLATLGLAGVGTLATIMTGNPWLGIAALTTWVGSVLFPFINWALFGFANFLGMIAATTGNPVSCMHARAYLFVE